MAKTQAPFLSLGAKGQLAKTVVASSWKGIKTMRQYVVPANPRTSAQVAHRSLFAAIVSLWKKAIVAAADIAAWNRLALQTGKPQSGFNAFTSSILPFLQYVTGTTVYYNPSSSASGSIAMSKKDSPSGSGSEPSVFRVYIGPTEAKLTEREYTGTMQSFTYTPQAGDKFFKIGAVADNAGAYCDVSGIYPIPTVA